MRFIAILLIIFIILRLVLKPLLRFVIQTVMSKMAQQGGVYTRSYTYTNQKSKPEGTIDVTQQKSKKGNDAEAGEYIDYEEVK